MAEEKRVNSVCDNFSVIVIYFFGLGCCIVYIHEVNREEKNRSKCGRKEAA